MHGFKRAELLVNMWEHLHVLTQDLESVRHQKETIEEDIEKVSRASEISLLEIKMLKRDLDALYGYDHDDDEITLELPEVESPED